jgi:hypothetical protein
MHWAAAPTGVLSEQVQGESSVTGKAVKAPVAQSKWLSESATKIAGSDADEVRSHYDISNEFFRLW